MFLWGLKLTNKIIEIPVSTIDSLITGGKYRLRYRIKSKNGLGVSEWSSIKTVSYPISPDGSSQAQSFYETYMGVTATRPQLSADPHPSSPYSVTTVQNGMGSSGEWFNSWIKSDEQDTGIYWYTWDIIPDSVGIAKKFDVYISTKNLANTTWSDWKFIGSTTGNSISFNIPTQTTQYVQAAVFLSSTPKLTSIANETAEVTLVSISPAYSTYYDAGGTIGVVTTAAPFRATITGLTGVPAGIEGRRIFATAGTGNFGSGKVHVASRTSTSITIDSTATFTAGTVTKIRL